MSQSTLKAVDAINGSLGSIYMKISGSSTRSYAGYTKSLNGKSKISKQAIGVMGTALKKQKSTGVTNDADMTIYYCSSVFAEMVQTYIDTGVVTYFDLIINNDDPSSTVGAQIITLKNCSLTDAEIVKFDVDDSELTVSISFSFEKIVIGQSFSDPTYE